MSTQNTHEKEKEKLQVYQGKEREAAAHSFWMEPHFLPTPPMAGVLWVEGWRSQWHCATCAALQPLSPLRLPQSLKKSWEEDAGEQRMSLRIQRTNHTGKSWKA